MHTRTIDGGKQLSPDLTSPLAAVMTRVLTSGTKRALPLAAGILLAWISSTDPAYALDSTVVECDGCQTTADFIAAATAMSNNYGGGGLYVVTSNSQAKTGYMFVQGHARIVDGDPTWVIDSVTPVDASGTLMDLKTEDYRQAQYSVTDIVHTGVDRNEPIILTETENTTGQPPFNSTDEQISDWIKSTYPNVTVRSGVITVQFADGTTAEFIKDPAGNWVWNGVAHNASGQPINRDGTLKQNTTTSGNGGGEATTSGIGSEGSLWRFDLLGSNRCMTSTTITWPGNFTYTLFTYLPCW